MIILILGFLAVVSAGSNSDNKESYKNQLHSGHNGKHREKHDKNNYSSEHCTDPRTMKKHPAYTEWADAYSCTRHRCQPGGRNLAIYTVGCKRVEAPESAIECEEVVEDTNMQFPFCCTRLRCLVVVRGEVWTRVLGQPWEVLPAAPWSHMYKMKKPPPADSTFLPNKATILDPLFYSDPYLNHSRTSDQGPVYELTETDSEQNSHDKMMLRSDKNNEQTGRKSVSESSDYNEIPSSAKTAMPVPDIVIALSTNTDDKELSHNKKSDSPRHNKRRQSNVQPPPNYFEEQLEKEKQAKQLKQEVEEAAAATEKVEPELELTEEEKEKFFANSFYAVTQKPHKPHHRDNTNNSPISWTEIPLWNEPKDKRNLEPRTSEYNNDFNLQEPQVPEHREPKHEALQIPAKKVALDTKPNNLQALVDAIGTRMRDIESVVQKMSDKVHQVKATTEGSNEKKASNEKDGSHKRNKDYKRPSTEDENYMRFTVNRGTKYLHSSTESTTEKPLFIEDSNLTGYFSDASNSILRRSNPAKVPKEPPPTYMAPVVENHHKSLHIAVPETSDDSDKKHKRHVHKKRRSKGAHLHKKRYRSKEDRRKHFNKLNSGDTEKNAVSVEESSDVGQ